MTAAQDVNRAGHDSHRTPTPPNQGATHSEGREPTRRRRPWTAAEENRLRDALRAGDGAAVIARAHGRTVGAIQARAARLLRPQVKVPRSEAIAALRKQLCDESLDSTHADGDVGHGRLPVERILRIWQAITETSLTSDHHDVFLQRPTTRTLADHTDGVLVTAGVEIWEASGRLRLDEWVERCEELEPQRPPLTIDEVTEGKPETATALFGLISDAVEDVPKTRDREILSRRLGLGNAEPETLQSIGDDLELTRQRVSQLQQQAIRALGRQVKASSGACGRSHRVLSSLLCDQPLADDRAIVLIDIGDLVFPEASPTLVAEVVLTLAGYRSRDSRRHIIAEVSTLVRASRRHTKRQRRLQREQEHSNLSLERLLDAAEWATEPDRLAGLPPELQPLRESTKDLNDDRRWYSPKLDRSVSYESKAELKLIRMLDQSTHVVDYCEQPIALAYDFDGTRHTYYPDLLVHLADGRTLVIEVKASIADAALWVNRAKFTAARRHCRTSGWGFLVTNGRQTLDHLTERAVPASIETLLRGHLAERELSWPEVQVLRTKHGFTPTDLAALAVRNSWQIRLKPWRVCAPGSRDRTTG